MYTIYKPQEGESNFSCSDQACFLCARPTSDFTAQKVAKTRILSKWLTKLTHLCCVLSLF